MIISFYNRNFGTAVRLPVRSLFQRLSVITALILTVSACSLTPTADTISPTAPPKAPTVALVLGGGGAKGMAHVGVIRALEDNGITPTLVVGTSVGSVVGSLYASGVTPDRLEQLTLTMPDEALMDFTLSNQGFIEGIKLKNFINKQVKDQAIEDFPKRFAAIAAEKHTLKKAVFTTGNAGLAVQASSSVPNIFIAPRIPEKIGKKYIDGGVVSLVPIDSARELGADIVIAVDVTATDKTASHAFNQNLVNITSLSSFWALLEQNLNTVNHGMNSATSNHRANAEITRADILITPQVAHISALDTRQRRALIEAGRTATLSKIAIIKQRIAEKSTNSNPPIATTQ